MAAPTSRWAAAFCTCINTEGMAVPMPQPRMALASSTNQSGPWMTRDAGPTMLAAEASSTMRLTRPKRRADWPELREHAGKTS